MIEFQEFPKMIYHPKTGAQVIVRDASQEEEHLEAWGVNEPPKIPLASPSDAPKPKAAPKARARKPKAA